MHLISREISRKRVLSVNLNVIYKELLIFIFVLLLDLIARFDIDNISYTFHS